MDRFEGGYAVLLFGDAEIRVDLPQVLLPPGTGEGSLLRVSLVLEPEEEGERRDRIEDLLGRLKDKSK